MLIYKNNDTCTDKKTRIPYKCSAAVSARTTFKGGLADTEMCTQEGVYEPHSVSEDSALVPAKLNVNSRLL